MKPSLLEKWACTSDGCGQEFLVDMARAGGNMLRCPFCQQLAESVTYQSPKVPVERQLEGCLWPLGECKP